MGDRIRPKPSQMRGPNHEYLLSDEVTMKYKIALKASDEGYSVSIPGLPGCWSQGETEAEAIANIEVALREYLSVVDDLLEDAEVREVEFVL